VWDLLAAVAFIVLATYMVWQLANLYAWWRTEKIAGAGKSRSQLPHEGVAPFFVEQGITQTPVQKQFPTSSFPSGEGPGVGYAQQTRSSPELATVLDNRQLSVAVLVPFRNEAANLQRIAASLLAQDYAGPTELIFIDDHSEDGGLSLLPPEVSVLRLADYLAGRASPAHKKAALTYAISQTRADIIITTDADCAWPVGGLRLLIDRFQAGADVVLGPVVIDPANGFCSAFQALDLAAYQFLTAASAWRKNPVLANGANFGFRRALFASVGGYEGVDHLPSGDDVLLLHKFKARPQVQGEGEVQAINFAYAAGAAVTTRPVAGWRALWNQRLRWAGKAGAYTDKGLQLAQGLAFGLSLAIVLAFILLPLHQRPRLLIMLWSGKALVDYLCLRPVMQHFGQGRTMNWYPVAALLYPFFLVAVGTAALLGFNTPWKGRQANRTAG
jgi:hypothetical protein